MTSLSSFLAQFGFVADPFEHIDAEQEPQLGDYFVPPPYFATVMGDPRAPKSHVVLAPRGGGKTAQRRMIELRSAESDDFLCVTYDAFDQPAGFAASDASLAYHLNQICRRLLLGILIVLDEDPSLADDLPEHQKQLLKFQIDRFLGSLSAAELRNAVQSLKNFGDRARDFFDKYAGPLRVLINALMSKLGMDKLDIPEEIVEEAKRDESLTYHFEHLLTVAQHIGFSSTYVLVDRVDEMPITSDASTTFEFIWPLLADLRTLETPGVGFKFFLWDEIQEQMDQANFRSDRVDIDRLRWTDQELKEMLRLRIQAYSESKAASFNDLLCEGMGIDAHSLIAHMANGSPRDMYRLANQIVAEQTRTSEDDPCVGADALWAGLRQFAEKRSGELVPASYMDDLRRIAKPTFTISHIANNVFRIHENSARRKVQLWTDRGVIKKVDEVPNPPNRPSYLFGVVDPRVAIAMLPTSDVNLILATQIVLCPNCQALCVSDESTIACMACSTRFSIADAQNLLDHVTDS